MSIIKTLWRANAALTAVGLLMLAALLVSLAGMWIDPRVVTGAPAWLKPSKFHLSVAVYTLTLAWVFTYLPAWRRTRLIVGWTNALVFVVELAIVDLQAWRGTSSHFNVGTPLDALLFNIMGGGITVQTLSTVVVAAVLWLQVFPDRAIGWALRLGMSMTIASAVASGGLMLTPTQDQIEQSRVSHHMSITGAHTVGAPDGGPGIPGLHWSRDHGDLRISHFVGLHSLQALSLLVLLLPSGWSATRRVRVTMMAAASYAGLFVVLLWQALRGQSIVAPDAATLAAFSVWIIASAVLMSVAARAEAAREVVAAY